MELTQPLTNVRIKILVIQERGPLVFYNVHFNYSKKWRFREKHPFTIDITG